MTSELRFNTLKGEWVLFSAKRADKNRKSDIHAARTTASTSAKNCPFENFEKTGNLPPYFQLPEKGKKWNVLVFPNKYPGVTTAGARGVLKDEKFHSALAGYGHHDLLITRDHYKNFSDISEGSVLDVLHALKKRYVQISDDPAIEYVAMFQNRGAWAGGSLYHPHMQIISLPVTPAHIAHELMYSLRYYEKNKSCVYCDLLRMETKQKERMVFSNGQVAAFVPFAAQEPYEVLIFPKKHATFFEKSSDELVKEMAVALKKVLLKIKKGLGDPDYNLYIHTAPATNGGIYPYHHWYIRILPKLNESAGFELGTGIEINTVFPEDAARLLKING